jgi:DNA-binding transcriptional LysR family regulator
LLRFRWSDYGDIIHSDLAGNELNYFQLIIYNGGMETLANLEAFVRSAELGGFSAAARRLGLTPAAVSRNVAMLERNLGIRLFQRSTRRLTLTESGEQFLQAICDNLDGLQAAIAGAKSGNDVPAGVLKVSMSVNFGLNHIVPMLPDFRARYPQVLPDWRFENRPVDLIAEGYDAAIGGGFDLTPVVVARALAPAHIVAVAAPAYMTGRAVPTEPDALASFDGIVMRSTRTGRVVQWTMRDVEGREASAKLRETIVLNDPAAMVRAVLLGLGVTMIAVPDAQPYLEDGELIRLLPKWYADAGAISLYYASRTLLPAKTRVFVDFIAETFRDRRLAERFAGSLG